MTTNMFTMHTAHYKSQRGEQGRGSDLCPLHLPTVLGRHLAPHLLPLTLITTLNIILGGGGEEGERGEGGREGGENERFKNVTIPTVHVHHTHSTLPITERGRTGKRLYMCRAVADLCPLLLPAVLGRHLAPHLLHTHICNEQTMSYETPIHSSVLYQYM